MKKCIYTLMMVLFAGVGYANVAEDSTDVEVEVWPGDANNDGVVDMDDLLSIGMGFGLIGDESFFEDMEDEWMSYEAYEWEDTLENGVNAVFADTDGSGEIDEDDVFNVLFYMDFEHGRSTGSTQGAFPLTISMQEDSVAPGEVATFDINLGGDTGLANEFLGISFGLAINSELASIDMEEAVYLDDHDWDNDELPVFYDDDADVLEATVVHYDNETNKNVMRFGRVQTNHTNVEGGGLVTSMKTVIEDDVDLVMKGEDMLIEFVNVSLITEDGTQIAVEAQDYQVEVSGVEIETSSTNELKVSPEAISFFPNPSNGNLFWYSTGMEVHSVEVVDMIGKKVYNGGPNQHKLELGTLDNGVYFLKINTNKKSHIRKFVITH